MSDPKEETAAAPKAEEAKPKKEAKPKTKKPAAKKTATKKETKKKAAPKKTTTKKAAPKKDAAKKTKKLVKKAVKPKKAAPKKTTEKKTKKAKETTKKAAPKTAAKFGKYDQFIAEAIVATATEEKQWVSYSKIKQYLLDYMDGAIVAMIPKQCKKAILALVEKKYLKAKKDSYQFTAKGKEKLAPAKVEKRKKIDRPEKKVAPPPKEEPKKEIKTMSGRVSKSVF